MSQKTAGKDPNLVNKLSKLKEKQDNWMKEREISNNGNSKDYVHSSLKPSDSLSDKGKNTKAKVSQDAKKAEAVVWTTNSNYNGFVVRNGSGSARSRPNSGRTPVKKTFSSSKKTFTHSSLKKQTNQLESKKSTREKKLSPRTDGDGNGNIQSDESLSSSFTEHITNLDLNNFATANSPKKTNDRETTFMANHFCVLCKQTMVNEERKPTMVFPCGHSFCRKCIINKKQCPDCKCEIISTQTNSALYAVIQQFKQKSEKEEMEKKEKQIRKYLDEYKTLNTRISLMKGEATNIIDDMEEITHHLINKQETIKNVEYDIEEIESEIQSLRMQIQYRHQDLELEKSKVKNLEKRYEKQKGQFNMLQNTIDSLSQNKEKVREMVHELSPNAVDLLNDLDEEG